LLSVLLGLMIFLGGCSAVSVGVTPGTLDFKDLLRDGYAEREIIVSTSGDRLLEGRVSIRKDSDISDWLTVEPKIFDLDSKDDIKIKVFIRPPADAANGKYDGMIDIRVAPKELVEGTGSVVGVAVSAGVKTTAFVTDRQVKRYAYRGVNVKDIEEGNPIEVKLTAINTGNVRISPEIRVDILDQLKKNVVKTVDYSETEILPTAREGILITIPTDDMKLGQYWARVILSQDGQEIGREMITFDYLERGALRVKGVLNGVRSSIWVQVGDTARIDASFSNIGEMVTLAKAKFQIYEGEALKEVIDSEEIRVEVGETVNLTAFYKAEEVGRYEAFCTVFYSGKITDEKSTILNVNPRVAPEAGEEEEEPAPSGGDDYTWIIVILALIIVTLVAIRFMNTKKRGGGGRRKRSGLSGY